MMGILYSHSQTVFALGRSPTVSPQREECASFYTLAFRATHFPSTRTRTRTRTGKSFFRPSGAAPPQMATGHATSAGRSGDRKVTSRESGAEFTQPASEMKRPVVYALFAAVAEGAPVHYYTSAGCADDDR